MRTTVELDVEEVDGWESSNGFIDPLIITPHATFEDTVVLSWRGTSLTVSGYPLLRAIVKVLNK